MRADPLGCGYCFQGEISVLADYVSNNSAAPGYGQVHACLRDEGNGAAGNNGAFVIFLDGPFGFYAVEGHVSGNVTDHGCN